MSSDRKAFLVWWTALLLCIAAAYIKHKKAHHEPEPKDNVRRSIPAPRTPAPIEAFTDFKFEPVSQSKSNSCYV